MFFSLINKIKQLYKPLAECKRSYGAYSSGKGNFQIRAISDDDVFVVADNIPFFMVAELIAELLNVAAGVATPAEIGWLDRAIREAEDNIRHGKDHH
jgi:hypothetical protein